MAGKNKFSEIYHNHKTLMHWGIFAIVAVCAWGLLYSKINDYTARFLGNNDAVVRLAKSSARISLDPQTQAVKVGDVFPVDIVLDTGETPTDGVDIYSLHYDPALLAIVDDVSSKNGVQITPGVILPINAANIVDNKQGNLKFSQVAQGGTTYKGRGILATIHFKALGTGTAYLQFDFNKGSTVDSNVAFRGQDKLSTVVDGIFQIQPK